MPQIALDYIAEVEEKFIRIYDDVTDRMLGRWVYPQNFKSDQDLAVEYSFLGYAKPHICNVTVPPGIRVKGYTADNSSKIYLYELESGAGIVFSEDRPLPAANPSQSLQANGPKLLLGYTTDQNAQFIAAYDHPNNAADAWLLEVNLVEGKTSSELQALFNLPYLPNFVCDVSLPPNSKIYTYVSNGLPHTKVYKAKDGAIFSNERAIIKN